MFDKIKQERYNKVIAQIRNNINQNKYVGVKADVTDEQIIEIIKYQNTSVFLAMKEKISKIKLEKLGSFLFVKAREKKAEDYVRVGTGYIKRKKDDNI